MRCFFTFLLFYFFTFNIHAQVNLVPNPSFEDTINCPNGIGQINKCMLWYNPSTGSPDYFNSCADPITTGTSVPVNSFGFQHARTGNAYTGLHMLNPPSINLREYIQVQLNDSLKKDSIYCVSFYTCLDNFSNTAITEIGLYLSNNPIINSSFLVFPVIPQITSPANVYLKDTINWVKTSGYFTALGGEKYITIGNFKDDFTVDTISWNLNDTNCFPFCFPKSHYYIDDVSVIKCDTTNPFDETSIANVFTPNNDGINEQWVLNNLPEKTQVQIYNRWGVLVAGIAPPFTIQGTYKWDGRTTSGISCVEGTYFYLIYTPDKTYKGFVQLVR
jgi:gliding motility-associated-like protein